jgi:hypothetical protein
VPGVNVRMIGAAHARHMRLGRAMIPLGAASCPGTGPLPPRRVRLHRVALVAVHVSQLAIEHSRVLG